MNKTYDFILKYCKDKFSSVNIADFEELLVDDVDWNEVKQFLKRMQPEEYRRTRYWKIISKYLRHNSKCSKCGYDKSLHVHHKSYKYVGNDHLHLDNLEVLCCNCHNAEHRHEFIDGKLKKKNKSINKVDKKERMSKDQFHTLLHLLIGKRDKVNLKRLKKYKINKDEASKMIALLCKEKATHYIR
jgi:5-methylcytosine-specific restriction endonuclease McrA